MKKGDHFPLGSRAACVLCLLRILQVQSRELNSLGTMRKAVEKTSTSLLSAAPETLLEKF